MTIIDSILAKIGLMKVEDHIAETNRLNLELTKQDNALSEAKAEARKAADDCAKLVKDYGTRGDLLAAARKERDEAFKSFNDAFAELSKFRAKRDRDNAGRRERRARNATGAQKSGPARTKKVAG